MGFFEKIKKGLTKTRNAISGLFAGDYEVDDEFYDEQEERLILADLGVDIATRAVEQLRKDAYEKMLTTPDRVRAGLADILTDILDVGSTELKLDSKPAMVLVIGVNGVGKTTTIGKLSNQLAAEGKRVLLCAADTVRAAAADQLEIWANRADVELVRQHEGADPASVVYDGISAAKAREIQESFQSQQGLRHLAEFLSGYRLPAELAVRIYRAYGELSMMAIQDNPYFLTEEGFNAPFTQEIRSKAH